MSEVELAVNKSLKYFQRRHIRPLFRPYLESSASRPKPNTWNFKKCTAFLPPVSVADPRPQVAVVAAPTQLS